MDFNQYKDIMQECRHIFFEQNHRLMNISAKIVAAWARLPSKASTKNVIREIESVHTLHIIVDKNYLQQVGLVSSGQRRQLRR